MTDYNPRPPPIGPEPGGRSGMYLVVGVLVVLFLASGVLFFNNPPPSGQQISQPEQPPKQ